MSAEPSPAAKAGTIGIGLLVVLALIGGFLAYRQVPEGHTGVTKQWGAATGEKLSPGAHWKIPIMESVQDVEIRPRTYTMSDTSGEGKKAGRQDAVVVQTVNGTTVRVDVTVRYRVETENADDFVIQWNNVEQMEQRLIRPTVRSELRDEAAALPTSTIYTAQGREQLAEAARDALQEEFGDEAVHLEAIQVRQVDLPQSYDDALNEKEIAKQRVQREEYRVQQAKKEKRQQIIEAEADAESIEIRAQAYQENPIILKAEYIEAIAGGSVFVVPPGGNVPVIIDGANASANDSGNTTTVPTPP